MKTVLINGHAYQMNSAECAGLLNICKNQVGKGVYAIYKGDYVEIKNEKITNKVQLKKRLKQYNQKGFIALWV